ncbi:MAG: glycosyltransferase family 39 protein [Chloroflexi bacterium]|nr:glycosyltransferase family 39 protein [Chloroflexota bacterium]MCC6895189.1 glycosyltransferase family 39 protein [Anaerolineae bacterium]
MKPSQMSSRLFWSLLLVISLFSLVVRLYGINHGLPQIQTSDENSDLSTALRLTEGQMPPREVRYHRSFIAYVNMASVGGLYGYSSLTGKVDSLADFRDLYFSDRALFTQATRITLAILTTLAITLTGLIGRYINPLVGLFAAAVLATNGFFTISSLYALPDSLIAFSIALCLWMSMRLYTYKRQRDYVAAGLSLAVVMLSKFSGSTIAISIIIAHGAIAWVGANKDWRQFARRFVLSRGVLWLVVGVVVGNIALNPIAFIHIDDLIYEITRLNSYAYAGPLTIVDRLQIIVGHIRGIYPLIWDITVIPSLLGLIAAWQYRKRVDYWIIVGAFLFLMVTIANVSTRFYQFYYWIPWIGTMALVAGIGMDALIGWLRQIRLQRVASVAILMLILMELMILADNVYQQTAADTRQQALQYMSENWEAGTKIVAGDTVAYAVPLQRDETSIERAYALGKLPLQSWDWWLNQLPEVRPQPAYDVYGPEMQARVKTFEDLEGLIADEQITYVIEDDYCSGTTKRPDSESDLEFPAINDALKAKWELVMTFSPFEGHDCLGIIDARTGLALQNPSALGRQVRPGPVIRIYRVGTAN